MPLFFDPYYLLFMVPGVLLGLWAQAKVSSAFSHGRQIAPRSRMSGAEAAAQILRNHGLDDVGIEESHGFLSDHYDPRERVLRLSPDVYHGRSLASVGVAAHEAGHALQQALHYAPLKIRNSIVPLASVGGNLVWILLIAGVLMQSFGMITAGIALFSTVVLFQIVNLPVEFNASSRARAALLSSGVVTQEEDPIVGKVLNAAAMTYVAATITAVLQLLYFILRYGSMGRRD